MRPHVVCVGDLMVDVLARLPGPLAAGSDTPAAVRLTGGGAAANVACWLTTAGASATFVGRVGDDVAGRQQTQTLAGCGVAFDVAPDHSRPTGTCIVLVDPSGERTMIPDAGANDGLNELDAEARLPADADCLYVSGYALFHDGSRSFALAAIDVARSRGWTIAVDAASAAPLAHTPDFLSWVGEDALLLANTDEAFVLTGSSDPVDAAGTLAQRVGVAIVKCGAAGATYSSRDDGTRTVAAVATDVVDTTGAGDAFAAGYLAAILRAPGDVDAALAQAAEFGARAVSRPGARP